jgi:protein-serine/threonine kinase
MKVLKKAEVVKTNQVAHTKTERNVLGAVARGQHPFIVNLFYSFQTKKKLFFVMEYCSGGELFYHLARKGRFSENRCRFYAAEIVLALEHLHSIDVVFRDLKPENVLLDAEGHVKITDFGLSREGVTGAHCARTFCGTPEYLAPEILLRGGHGKAVDW